MFRADRPEPASNASGEANFSLDQFFHEVNGKGIVRAVEDHPKEAAVTAVGTIAAAAAAVYLTRGAMLGGAFRAGATDGVAANHELLTSLSRTGIKPLPMDLLGPGAEKQFTLRPSLIADSRPMASLHVNGRPLAAEEHGAYTLIADRKAPPGLRQKVDVVKADPRVVLRPYSRFNWD